MKVLFSECLATGFPDWNLRDYQYFCKALRKKDIGDIVGIAEEIEGKSIEDVQRFMNRYLLKFRNLKEKDIVMRKLNEKDFDDRNKHTIADFDIKKDYCIFL